MCPAASSHRPPECDRVNRRLSRSFTCPSRQTSENSTPVRAAKNAAKSLALKILPISRANSIFCKAPLMFSRIYEGMGGGGYPPVGIREARYSVVPEGTRTPCRRYPTLKRWAKLFRPCGAAFTPIRTPSHHSGTLAVARLVQPLKTSADLVCAHRASAGRRAAKMSLPRDCQRFETGGLA